MNAERIVAVKRAKRGMQCRRCGRTIERDRRAAVVFGTGPVHLRCLLNHPPTPATGEDQTMTTPGNHDQADDTSQA